ncbi:hypothetical protein NSS79_04170 [Paenibacillus sp. FSL L8-0436]|uniref:hypothetical protein n=1 Tax=Paenibacillus sp. FSL L8-0436 TaxID=2954686 RepID=UPI0031580039
MLLQNGVVTAEFSRTPYRPDCPQLLYSLSKSVTSIAVGIACDEGLMELEAPVISFFPDNSLIVIFRVLLVWWLTEQVADTINYSKQWPNNNQPTALTIPGSSNIELTIDRDIYSHRLRSSPRRLFSV